MRNAITIFLIVIVSKKCINIEIVLEVVLTLNYVVHIEIVLGNDSNPGLCCLMTVTLNYVVQWY